MPAKNQRLLVSGTLLFLTLVLSGCTKRNNEVPIEKPVTSNSPQVVLLDEGWEQYTNKKYQYSINFPKEFYIKEGSCIKNDNTNTYDFKAALSETALVEEENYTKIYPKTMYEISENKQTCMAMQNTENNNKNSWTINTFIANSETDLNNHIKSVFGNDCALEVLKPTKNPNVFDVIITRNDLCKPDSAYFFKFNELTKTGVSILLGNSFTFYKDTDFGNNAYDEQMLNSFEFVE